MTGVQTCALPIFADAGIFAAAAPAKEEPDETEEEPQTEPEQQSENGSSRHKRKEAL